MSEDETSQVIDKLTGPLFKKASTPLAPKETAVLYGLTFNPDPYKHFNNRQYQKYCHADQIRMLTRIEQSIRRSNPSIELIKLNFEVAPLLGQMHFHALYRMPAIFVSTLENHYRKYENNRLLKGGQRWPYLKIERLRNPKSWLKYIMKDEEKVEPNEEPLIQGTPVSRPIKIV